jgi:murein DD-endopeptidase MepM/ murein hydrolase activator NlpD
LIAELDDEIFSDIQVSKGDNFAKVLKKAGIKNSDIDKIIINGTDTYNFSKIYLGDVVKIFSRYEENLLEKFKLIYRFSNTEELIVSLNDEQNFEYQVNEIPLESEKVYVKGTIKTSLYEAMKDVGLSELAITEVIRIYSFDVDFQRDIYENDSFELLFTKKINEEGKTVEIEDPEYLQLTSRGTPLKYYLFTTTEFSEYFDEKGKGMTKSLMKTPINGARLSSGFGYRKHPILGYNKLHKGVDFAAPSGTPIFAAGNGVVEFAGKNGAYGNYVRIRHDGTFKTAYAHMKGFKKGIYDGARVKQGDIIGYVGTTGRSTGPHLHYEIIQNGEQMNPAKLKLPSGRKLNEKELNQFNNLMLAMNQELDELSKKYAFNEN